MEIISLEKLAVIIPSPNVVEDHQSTNAKELERKGLIKVIEEKEVTFPILSTTINLLVKEKNEVFDKMKNRKKFNSFDVIKKEIEGDLDGTNSWFYRKK